MSRKPTTKSKEVPTTGHSWDGIEEFDNPMPRWWLWCFYLTIIWGIGYSIAYPAWPLISKATPGLLGHATRADVAREIQSFNEANAPMRARLEATDLQDIAKDPELADFSRNAGAAIFRTWCMQCHGSGAAGVQAAGYPNLLDDDWLWGGDIESIYYTVNHGIRAEADDDTRFAEMPRFGADGLLEKEQIAEVVQHVLAISGQDHDATLAAAGATVFADNCVSCHGEAGEGSREFGAPRLNDAIWLFGGTEADITNMVENARSGVMPNWNARLSEADIRAVASYVHGLGGGE